ncbi:HPr family phosphocarrier protein [Salipaludibacillus daqingensis]|uniref:HPr family phosphocarrier protein n=1 Tax=Salipaludibacillus daqingensis TaxID=3041001 RepID=UPI0024755783|nr:HPr family phosphocarrier protein [Salipaludibacillus daqingensis]
MLKQDLKLNESVAMSNVLAIVHVSSLYESDVYILKDNIAYNSKNILSLVQGMIHLKKDAVITVQAEGHDANDAVNHIRHLVENAMSSPSLIHEHS